MAEEKEKLGRAIVARGRTITVPHPTKTKVVGYNPETNKPINGSVTVDYGPGQEVTLPESEIKMFRAAGFLEDPSKVKEESSLAEGAHYREFTS